MTRRVALLTVLVPEYDAGIEFFCSVLDFELLEDKALTETKRWVRVAPYGAETGLLLAVADTEAQRARIGDQAGGRVMGFVETADFAADHARFSARGLRFTEAPRHEPYGTVAVFRDPWGNTWDLIEYA